MFIPLVCLTVNTSLYSANFFLSHTRSNSDHHLNTAISKASYLIRLGKFYSLMFELIIISIAEHQSLCDLFPELNSYFQMTWQHLYLDRHHKPLLSKVNRNWGMAQWVKHLFHSMRNRAQIPSTQVLGTKTMSFHFC